MKTEEIHQSSSTVLCQTVPKPLCTCPPTKENKTGALLGQSAGEEMVTSAEGGGKGQGGSSGSSKFFYWLFT